MAMKITVVQGDITQQRVDAIVNAANEQCLGGGGVDGAIHSAAGPQLLDACEELPVLYENVRCETGSAVVTPGFRLCKYVIHAVGPVYNQDSDPQGTLENAIRMSLRRAVAVGARTVAFPAISCGAYGFPHDEAANIAMNVMVMEQWDIDEVRFVLRETSEYRIWRSAAGPMLSGH